MPGRTSAAPVRSSATREYWIGPMAARDRDSRLAWGTAARRFHRGSAPPDLPDAPPVAVARFAGAATPALLVVWGGAGGRQ
ncbi:hypothetical protein E2562_034110 [Oryza meyeriana var. granulata]|uniref:Uncharacterized protein n=1 Tax=Oryza meyeriana var. granulata TaxID=110450 RepID=A0A6G1E6H5_9ORYZ|nr:hypothetical protein E2562_034110 [Oryza meyeriana var. granulata]